MKLYHIWSHKKISLLAAFFLILISVYLVLDLYFFNSDPVIAFLKHLNNFYLSTAEALANLVLKLSGATVRLSDHSVLADGTFYTEFTPEVRYKKIVFLILLLIWFTRTRLTGKILYTILTFLVHIICISVYLAVAANLSISEYDYDYILSIPHTAALLSLFTILFAWYWTRKEAIKYSLSRIKIKTGFLETRDTTIMVLIYIYLVVGYFLLEYFDFLPWINLIFNSAQKILLIFGHKAAVEPFYLVGSNGSIYMAKYCLGFKAMLLFASMVYVTGRKDMTRWIYIVAGIIFLNLVNILRFVLLFIHIQRNGSYMLAMDLHAMYNLITYTIIFMMWILWFEKYSDISPDKNRDKASI